MAISCRNCGNSMNDDARFCSSCGAATAPPSYAPNASASYRTPTRLIRPRSGRMVAGVCEGLAYSYAWDVTWVRVLTVLLTIFGGGLGLVAYVVFWIVMPEEPLALPQATAWPPQS